MPATERTATGRFPPGRSGNPAGRPPGSRNKSTLALEEALAARTAELVELLVGAASQGKAAALRICFDHVAPLRKGRPVPFALPPLTCHDDAVAAAAGIVAGVADGELTPEEAQDIFKLLEAFVRLLTSPARAGRAPSADAAATRQPRAPAKACKSSGFSSGLAAGAGDEDVVVPDRVPTSPGTPEPAPSVDAETCRQPSEPAEACRSSCFESPGSDVGVSVENVVALDPVPTSPTVREPAPPADTAACRGPSVPAESCRSPGCAHDAGGKKTAGHAVASKPAGTPQLLRRAVETVAGAGIRFERMLDLGCGAGLAGEAFAPLCRTVVGVDRSPAMIEVARRKGVYVELAVADMTERLAREPDSSADLVVAAGAFVYLSDLMAICREAARVLIPRGLLAFSVATHQGSGVILGENLRYAHAAGHVGAALDAAGLAARVLDPAATRHDGGIAVPALIVVAERARPPPGWAGRGIPGRRG